MLSGTHMGAEVFLSTTETVLGKDEDCDLVLDDVSLADKHISLRKDESGTSLTLLNDKKPIYIDGKEFSEKATLLKAFQVIRIGTLFLAVGPANEEWPSIDSLLDNKTNQEKDDDDEQADSSDDSKADGNDRPVKQAIEKKAKASRSRFPWIYLFTGTTLITVTILIALVYMATTTTKNDEDHKLLKAEQINRIMLFAEKYGAEIVFRKPGTEGGLAEISGYIDTESDRRLLLDQLEKIDIHAEIDIISSEKIMHAISAVIDQFRNHNQDSHVEVTAVKGSPGDFILKGYVKNRVISKHPLVCLSQ